MSDRALELDVDRIAEVVQASPNVAGLYGGRYGEVATYLPGRQVPGIRRREELIEVHVVGVYPTPLQKIEDDIRARLAAVGVTATVIVGDVVAAGVAARHTTTMKRNEQ